MPLNKSRSKAAFKSNVSEMIKAGHPQDQALAAAYRIKNGYAYGGDVRNQMMTPERGALYPQQSPWQQYNPGQYGQTGAMPQSPSPWNMQQPPMASTMPATPNSPQPSMPQQWPMQPQMPQPTAGNMPSSMMGAYGGMGFGSLMPQLPQGFNPSMMPGAASTQPSYAPQPQAQPSFDPNQGLAAMRSAQPAFAAQARGGRVIGYADGGDVDDDRARGYAKLAREMSQGPHTRNFQRLDAYLASRIGNRVPRGYELIDEMPPQHARSYAEGGDVTNPFSPDEMPSASDIYAHILDYQRQQKAKQGEGIARGVTRMPGLMAEGMIDLPKRAMEESERLRTTGEYDPKPVLGAAMLPMGAASPFAQIGAVGAFGGKLPSSITKSLSHVPAEKTGIAGIDAATSNISPAMRALQERGKMLGAPLQSTEEAAGGALDAIRRILEADRGRGFASGGMASQQFGAEVGGMGHSGFIHSPIAGRTDKIPMGVKSGSYVMPADVLSGVGEGNSLAGAHGLNKMFGMGPYGVKATTMHATRAPRGRHFADGGDTGQPTDIIAAGGEFVVPPEKVAQIGGGDMDRGHNLLDAFVRHVRKKTIKTLRKLPGPKLS